MKPNRYIKAMEIGLAHEKEGISYFDLVAELEKSQGEIFNRTAERTFLSWFLENFETSGGSINTHDREFSVGFPAYYSEKISKKEFKMTPDQKKCSNFIKRQLERKYFLKGLAAKQFLDYQELVESRQTAQDAREASTEANEKAAKSIRLAIWAIVVSAAVGLFSIIIDLVAFSKSPIPPYEVKVIEDKSRAEQLKRENGELKHRLNKAQMMLEAYESDSVSVSGS